MGTYTIVSLSLAGTSIILNIIIALARKKAKDKTLGAEDNVSFIDKLSKILSYVTSAEKLFNSISKNKTGELKLQDVITKLKVDCLENGKTFNEDEYNSIVNKLITFSKEVNNKSNQLDNQTNPFIRLQNKNNGEMNNESKTNI